MNHYILSLIKSGFRIAGLLVLILFNFSQSILWIFATLFLVAEILGILEEKFDKRKE